MTEAAKLYDDDFYLWTRNQADAVRRLAAERWNGPLDLEHLAEEVEDLGKSLRRLLTAAIRGDVEPMLEQSYAHARRIAVLGLGEHGEVDSVQLLPKVCPYTLDQVLDQDWLPANQHGLVDRFT